MLNRDFAGTTSQIANTTRITPVQQVDYASAVDNFLNQYRTSADRYAKEQEIAEQKQKTQNLVEALNGGDENAINKAYATYDPSGFLARQFAVKDKADDRSWQEKLNDIAYQRQKDLANYKASLTNANATPTNKMRNYQFLLEQGYTPEQASVIAFGGSTEAVGGALVNGSLFGEKGNKKADETMGKQYAEDVDALRTAEANIPSLEKLVGELNGLSDDATYTKAGALTDNIYKEVWGGTTKGAKASSLYETKINQQLLPLLRQTFGAAFTEKDRESLIKTMGDPYATPEIKKATLDSFIQSKYDDLAAKKRKVESYNKTSTTGNNPYAQVQENLSNIDNSQDIKEGTIIENANGERMILRGGQWQAI